MIKFRIINLKIEADLYRRLRIAVAESGSNIRKYVRNAIIEKLATTGHVTLKQPAKTGEAHDEAN